MIVTNDTMPQYIINLFAGTETKNEDIMLDTTGDRIMHLLRTHGRADVGDPYKQADLLAWLTGEQPAPNGKTYKFNISKTHLSQLINEKLENRIVDEYRAIGEIFDVDMEWLLTGNTVGEKEDKYDTYITPEAGAVAKLVDGMDRENREFVLSMAQHIGKLDNETRQLDIELAVILARNIDRMPEQDRPRIRLILSQMQSRKLTDFGSATF